MKLPRFVRTVGKRVVNAVPLLRRQILFSTDYQVLSGADQARSLQASSGGWLALRKYTMTDSASASSIPSAMHSAVK